MAESCDSCACGISDDDFDVEIEEIPSYMPFQESVRSYVLKNLDVEDEDAIFINSVEICPERVKVTYSERL